MSTARTTRGAARRAGAAAGGRRSRRARAAVGAVGGAVAVVMTAAGGAGATTAVSTGVPLPLAPDAAGVSSLVVPVENLPGLELTDVIATDSYSTVPVDPGGEVRIALPEGLEVPDAAGVTLRMVDVDEPELAGPEPLTFTADGSSALAAEVADGVLTVALPPAADLRLEEENEGVLTFPTTSDVPGYGAEAAFYDLDLASGTAAPEVDLAPVLLTTSVLDGPTVPAGGVLALSLPQDSALRAAGVRSLEDVLVVLDDLGRDEVPPVPGVDSSPDAALVSLDDATEPGDYRAAVLLVPAAEDGTPLTGRASVTSVDLEVTEAAAPAPEPSATAQPVPTQPVPTEPEPTQPEPTPTAPAVNPGLRSNTGVEEPTTGAGGSALLVGGGLTLAAASGALLLGVRRRTGR
ncbi:hypothetical protein WDZ17_03270 [Pseudokineococcus basanitobsidens]|uniref:Gram-positive cocci surface proteins LPxTG domain-containing protein n=1 Tax=Pseudokineococcus basanitobsidens TaxID=1926649 RepID=A0ABU8RH62_9ACTN